MVMRAPMLVAFFLALILTGYAARSDISPPLRGGIDCDKATIALAFELSQQGWVYIMPQPKSPQAAWGTLHERLQKIAGLHLHGF